MRIVAWKFMLAIRGRRCVDKAFYSVMRVESLCRRCGLLDDEWTHAAEWNMYVFRFIKISKVIRGPK